MEADVKELVITNERITGIQTQHGQSTTLLTADKVILATGIWARTLCTSASLPFPVPVIPVGHPYQHASPHVPISSSSSSQNKPPFVRWPESHAYARDHGDRHGLGSYNHIPILCAPVIDGEAISQTWPSDFDDALRSAEALLPEATRAEFTGSKAFNGIFSMTPDNMPLAGAAPSVRGLYLAVAVWVTHAAGTAKFLASLIDGRDDVDGQTRESLEPERFRGQDYAALEEKSLRGYNEIYKTEELVS